MIYRGEVKNGVIVLEGSGSLPDGMRVSIRPLKRQPSRQRARKDGSVTTQPSRRIAKTSGKGPPSAARSSGRSPAAKQANEKGQRPPTLAKRLASVIGKVKDLPSDLSVNLDHYLYGLPKRE